MGAGCCYSGELSEVVRERIDGKRKVKAALEAIYAGVEPDDLEL